VRLERNLQRFECRRIGRHGERVAETDGGRTRRKGFGLDAQRCNERRLVEVKLAVEAAGYARELEVSSGQLRPAATALIRCALQRARQLDTGERQRISAGPAADIERSGFVFPGVGVEPPASLHRVVDRVRPENAGEAKIERKLGRGRQVLHGESDPRQLPVRVRAEVAVIDHPRSGRGTDAVGHRLRYERRRWVADLRPVGDAVSADDKARGRVRDVHGIGACSS
jgi:hypothetical protein